MGMWVYQKQKVYFGYDESHVQSTPSKLTQTYCHGCGVGGEAGDGVQ